MGKEERRADEPASVRPFFCCCSAMSVCYLSVYLSQEFQIGNLNSPSVARTSRVPTRHPPLCLSLALPGLCNVSVALLCSPSPCRSVLCSLPPRVLKFMIGLPPRAQPSVFTIVQKVTPLWRSTATILSWQSVTRAEVLGPCGCQPSLRATPLPLPQGSRRRRHEEIEGAQAVICKGPRRCHEETDKAKALK